jgi:hypothetical protein
MKGKKSTKYAWKKLSNEKPKVCGKYAIVTYQKPGSFVRPISPCEVVVKWARWDYEEQLCDLNGEFVIYKKVFRFFSEDKSWSDKVVYWCELPELPEELRNSINQMEITHEN